MIDMKIIDDLDGDWLIDVEGLEVRILHGTNWTDESPVEATGAVWAQLEKRGITASQILNRYLQLN